MRITATNGCTYEVQFAPDEQFKIIKTNPEGVISHVMFMDMTIGNKNTLRKEAIFYIHEVDEFGNVSEAYRRENVKCTEAEYNAFFASAEGQKLQNDMVLEFLRKKEYTEPVSEQEQNTDGGGIGIDVDINL